MITLVIEFCTTFELIHSLRVNDELNILETTAHKLGKKKKGARAIYISRIYHYRAIN